MVFVAARVGRRHVLSLSRCRGTGRDPADMCAAVLVPLRSGRSERRWSWLEVGEHGVNAPVLGRVVGEVEFAQNAADVSFDRFAGYEELFADAAVGAPLRHQCEHLALAGAEFGQRVDGPGVAIRSSTSVGSTTVPPLVMVRSASANSSTCTMRSFSR